MKRIKIALVLAMICLSSAGLKGQDFAVKTNLLYDATATFNAGAEFGVAPSWTFDISGNFNPWTWANNMKWKHWMLQPELRWWTCNRFTGHFFGVHAIVGQYNFGGIKNNLSFLGSDFSRLTDSRFQGWAAGAGVAYGYALPISKHWNVEFEAGAGGIWTRFDTFDCSVCNNMTESGTNHIYWGLTKLAIGIVYLF